MNTSAFETANPILNPINVSNLSGRYETTARDKAGNPVQVIRSIRHAPKELVIQGTITPNTPSSDDVDNLCNLFQAKASFAPNKNMRSANARTIRNLERTSR
mmetsp:Transcript_31690/g.60522  ORF Transcript_31690/g.60522 Transcript_31690/m.60522 type:complete len:102 (-) Transcript_31690:285-590(-)